MRKVNVEDLEKVSGGISDNAEEKQRLYEEGLKAILKEESGPKTAVIGKCPICGKENRMGGNIICRNCKIKNLKERIFGKEQDENLNANYFVQV